MNCLSNLSEIQSKNPFTFDGKPWGHGHEALQSIEDPFLLWHRHLHANGLALENFDHGTTVAAMAMANFALLKPCYGIHKKNQNKNHSRGRIEEPSTVSIFHVGIFTESFDRRSSIH